ncbi:MAG: TetR/AcrR family transcriptional regulator [Atopobiaceae bacterium]|nr:TetR/AcrR family transcriptional regulator [Atopobiaceae bacterium]
MSTYATDSLGPALLTLMAERDIRKVTADELAARAGVGRATYFRNFSSKEEVLTSYLVRRWRLYEKECRLKELPLSHPVRAQRYFEFCLSLRAENDLMIVQGCSGAILAAFETIVSDADLGRKGGYEAAFLAYGLYGMFVAWAHGGWRETPQEMAALVSSRVLGGLGS